ncbi:GNAT family N-acetyltransferase [Ralstonia pickettii]|uniref:GNAT family N-acetyltransferase n=1 Tax=Ralstonia pickettii TaxID=329 RepID=A0A2N4TTX1_RALPI|nr:GNAT family protein [Ralstonia pickettii]PLC43157.1 GNAT family N-acetyltransferase [Ralstonia pickettii]
MTTLNAYQQPIGAPLPGWTPRPLPPHTPLAGRYCRLEPLDAARHADALFDAFSQAQDDRVWTYMVEGPFADIAAHRAYIDRIAAKRDPLQYAVIDARTDRPVGTLALMRITPDHGVIEVGAVTFSPLLQRTPASTEAQFLLMKHVFEDLGYRRYEWKCDSLNAPSRQTAQRLGFQFEGIFRQAVVYKGRSRDTAWFSIIDADWPQVRAAFEQWLSPENFDEDGRQRASLAALRSA